MGKYIVNKTAKDYSKMLNLSLFTSFLLLLAGGALFFLPDINFRILGYICGGCFFLYAFNLIHKYFKRDGAKLYRYNIVFSLVLVILGLLICLVPYKVVSFINIMFGISLIVIGISKINYATWFKIASDSSWFITMFIGIMLLAFGFLVIMNPFAKLSLNQVIGTFLVFLAILDLTSTIMLKRRAEKIVKIFW